MKEDNPSSRLPFNPSYEMFVLALAFISVINEILLLLPLNLPPEARQVVLGISALISLFLIVDGFYKVFRQRGRRRYFFEYYGWMTILGSIPGLHFLRLIQFWLAVRKLGDDERRRVKTIAENNRAQSILLLLTAVAIVVFEFSAAFVLEAEFQAAGANIVTAEDALWWAYVTVMTVGYGDKYPVTSGGRIVGTLLMAVGISLISVFTSFVTNWFRTSRHRRLQASTEPVAVTDTDDPRARLLVIQRLLDQQELAYQEATTELRNQLGEIEELLS
ncbi:MAG: potassium channel family protein [Chloroflexota bacterium]|nr:potassium channel family protein [Chloroflexota bacterium]